MFCIWLKRLLKLVPQLSISRMERRLRNGDMNLLLPTHILDVSESSKHSTKVLILLFPEGLQMREESKHLEHGGTVGKKPTWTISLSPLSPGISSNVALML